MTTRKVAIVTGSTSGIGRATAERLLRQGHRVMFNARADSVPSGILDGVTPEDADYCAGDISSQADAASIVERTVERWGQLDHLVNNAGRTVFIPHDDLAGPTPEIWQQLLSTNVVGTWNMIKFAAPQLERSGGAIVNVVSMAGVTAGQLLRAVRRVEGGRRAPHQAHGPHAGSKGAGERPGTWPRADAVARLERHRLERLRC